MNYSITFRPKDYSDELGNQFIKIIEKVSIKYYVGYESGDTTKSINHLQCHVQSNHSRTNLLRRAIQKANEEMEFTTVNLKIKEISHDPQYQLGYCQKESKGHKTNFPEKELKEAKDVYDKADKSLKKAKISKGSATTDDVLRAFIKWVEDNHISNPSVTHAKQFCIYLWKRKDINWNTYCKMNFKELDDFIRLYFEQSQFDDNFKNISLPKKV